MTEKEKEKIDGLEKKINRILKAVIRIESQTVPEYHVIETEHYTETHGIPRGLGALKEAEEEIKKILEKGCK